MQPLIDVQKVWTTCTFPCQKKGIWGLIHKKRKRKWRRWASIPVYLLYAKRALYHLSYIPMSMRDDIYFALTVQEQSRIINLLRISRWIGICKHRIQFLSRNGSAISAGIAKKTVFSVSLEWSTLKNIHEKLRQTASCQRKQINLNFAASFGKEYCWSDSLAIEKAIEHKFIAKFKKGPVQNFCRTQILFQVFRRNPGPRKHGVQPDL